MTTEELLKLISEAPHQQGEEFKLKKAQSILRARLSAETDTNLQGLAGKLLGLGTGLGQVNQAIRDGIRSNEKLASESQKQSRWMVVLTVALVVVGALQVITAAFSGQESRRLSRIARDQLEQARLDSSLMNRPYVEVRPVNFRPTGVRDPKDLGSEFCELTLEVKNYGPIPAKDVTLSDFKMGSPSRGFMTPENTPFNFKGITIFPNTTLRVVTSFVMSPENTLALYDNGKEVLEMYFYLNYSTAKDVQLPLLHWYKCNWSYGVRQFSIQNSESDSTHL